MLKRKIEIKYDTAEENDDNTYTFIIPSDKYKNINIKYTPKDNKKEDKKKKGN